MCLFCKIVKNEIPSYKVFESKDNFAFLDINPKTYGHTLIIPKKHSDNFLLMETNELASFISDTHLLANKVKDALQADGINIISNIGECAGQQVMHTHYHIVPKYNSEHALANIEIDFNEILKKLG